MQFFATVDAMIVAMEPRYPVYYIQPNVLRETASQFLKTFPGRVLYAIKCNPNPRVVELLYGAGIRHFDTASLAEIAQVREQFRDAGCYSMHPVKAHAAIRTAYEVYGIRHFVIDSHAELEKVMDETGGEGVTCVVCVATPTMDTAYDLSEKFGCQPEEAPTLLKEVHKWKCQVGLSFHIGSQYLKLEAWKIALDILRKIMDEAQVDIHMLDDGGGFPAACHGVQLPLLESFMDEIEAGLKQLDLRTNFNSFYPNTFVEVEQWGKINQATSLRSTAA